MTAQAASHLPEPGQIVLQVRPKDQVDLVKVCTSCGLVVAWGYEARHAAPHPEYDEQVALRDDLDIQISQAEARIAALLPDTEYAVLTSVPGWGSVRVAAYAAGAAPPPPRWARSADGQPPQRSTGRPG